MTTHLNRRRFIQSSGAAALGLSALGAPNILAATTGDKLRVLSIGVIGTIGGTDRKQVAGHPNAIIAGLCDVYSNQLAGAAKDHPDAFTCRDYREAFEKHADKFDAVIVATPDHHHAPMMLTAMAHDKHVYGQKPLVHQLSELMMMEMAVAAKPQLVTQLGNQRMTKAGRRAAVEILRTGRLGKAIEAYCWTGSPGANMYFNYDKKLSDPTDPPSNLDWDLWQGPVQEAPYRTDLAPIKWRSWWKYGTNGLGDWGCHILDVIFFAYDELQYPLTVKTDCPEAPDKNFHVNPCKSTTTYAVSPSKFAGKTFPIHYYDTGQKATPEQLRIHEEVKGSNMTCVVCENGTLVLEADGLLKIYQNGKMTPGLRMEGLPEFPPLNHWHAWVDNCLGKKTELRTPFKDAIRITEPALLGVKATMFPGETLNWDHKKLAFTNNKKATDTIVRRQYRKGFAPPRVA
jgi:predicted dehydrogenase